MRGALAGLAALLLLAGCGAPSADLFEVVRSGKDANANVRLLVTDDGTVRCNKKKPVPMGSERLLTARQLARDLEKQAALGLELPSEKGSILAYRVRLEAGTIALLGPLARHPQDRSAASSPSRPTSPRTSARSHATRARAAAG